MLVQMEFLTKILFNLNMKSLGNLLYFAVTNIQNVLPFGVPVSKQYT